MFSISQVHFQPLGNDDEHVSDIQYDHEPIEESMEVVGSVETHADSTGNILMKLLIGLSLKVVKH